MLRFGDVFIKFEHGGEVHKVGGVDRDISSIFLIGARFTATHLTRILNIIDNKTSVVYNFSQATAEINIFVGFKIFKVIATQAPGHDKTKYWSPSLATTIKKVIGRIN